MMWSVWLVVGLVALLVAWRVFSSKPDSMESDDQRLDREHDAGLLTDAEYARKKAAVPH